MDLLTATALLAATANPAASDFRISEVMFAPAEADLEFVELVNAGTDPLPLTGVSIADARGRPVPVPSGEAPIPAGGFVVLVRDGVRFADAWPGVPYVEVTRWPALNDGSDAVEILRDGSLIDHVSYDGGWIDPRTPPGRSLERIDPADPETGVTAWRTSADPSGGTPGRYGPAPYRGERPVPGDIHITEILYETDPDRLPIQVEFVELAVVSAGPIDPNGLYLGIEGEGSEADSVRIGFGPDALSLHETAVAVWSPPGSTPDRIAVDLATAFPSSSGRVHPDRVWPVHAGRRLRNAGGWISLFAPDGRLIDRARYGPERHHPAIRRTAGLAIERIDWDGPTDTATNWTTSRHPDGGTPGYRTDRAVDPVEERDGLVLAPRVVMPDVAGTARVLTVSVGFFAGPSVTDVRVFDLDGRLVRTLADGRLSTGPDRLYWNGLGDGGFPCPTGVYVVLATAWSSGGRRRSARGVVVLAR